MTAMCNFFGISRAAYYAWRKRREQPDRDGPRLQLIEEAYLASRKTYGYRRIKLWLEQTKGMSINHKAVLRLMNKLGLRSVARKRKPYQRQLAIERSHHYQNILDRNFTASAPNQKWVTDIT